MSAITPDSYIKLVRFDVTKEHQITFTDLTAQTTYFQNLQGLELQASTYQRKDFKVRFPECIDDIENYNYLMYKNDSDSTPNYYQDKYFYCYITDMEYINDNMTEITIKLDVFQTYQFDFIYKQCFIEREHSSTDIVGDNVVPEGLEKGEYIQNDIQTFDNFNDYCYMVQVSKDENANVLYGVNVNGIYFSGGFYVCMSYADVTALVQDYTTDVNLGYDSILNVFIVPYNTTETSRVVQPKPLLRKISFTRYFIC